MEARRLVKLLWIDAPIVQRRVGDLPYMGAMRWKLDRAPIATPLYATHRSPFIADFRQTLLILS